MNAAILVLCACFAVSDAEAIGPPHDLIGAAAEPDDSNADLYAILSRFPPVGVADVTKSKLWNRLCAAKRMLWKPENGGPLVDLACQAEWTAYWTLERDAANVQYDCWSKLRTAEVCMWPDHTWPSTEFTVAYLKDHPISQQEWASWRDTSRKSLRELHDLIGDEAFAAGRMP